MFQRFRRADTLNRFARPYILLFYAFASIFVVIHVAMTHIHSKLETLDPLPPEIRELIFHHILSTRYKPLKCALSETCRKYFLRCNTVSLNFTMADLFFQGLDSELSAEESSRPYLNRARNASPHHLGPGQSPAGRRLRLLSSVKTVTLEDIGAVQGCLAAISTISKLNLPKIPQNSWTKKAPRV